ncbi:hypothetical protein T4D_7914 [Trichinella pseudospiralis]|uniref:Uncharacterized protein n=1 Tax=Trichinella pseudospiralis TaxID=6337 RepID=A0A0V1FCS0_TRIPS|nr:hypothetical protein T4D_7914 [Trichinella pseudospiralis]
MGVAASVTLPTFSNTAALVGAAVRGLLVSTSVATTSVVVLQLRSHVLRFRLVGSSGLVVDDRAVVGLGGNVRVPSWSVASASAASVTSETMTHFVEIILATAIHRAQMLLELIKLNH